MYMNILHTTTSLNYRPDSDVSSACTSGSLCNASISSGSTLRCSDRNDLDDRSLLLLLVDLALLTEFLVDCRFRRFLLMVRCKFLLDDDAALVVSQGCLRASWALGRSAGSSRSSRSMKSLASAETSFQCWKKEEHNQ